MIKIIARASKAFGALRKFVFQDGSLSRQTKKMVYQAVVLGVLLYAAETWPAKQKDIRRLEGFHHRCLRSILGINRVQQCVQHISNEEVRKQFDMQTSLTVMIACRRHFSSNNKVKSIYFNRLTQLWNSLPIINLDLSINPTNSNTYGNISYKQF